MQPELLVSALINFLMSEIKNPHKEITKHRRNQTPKSLTNWDLSPKGDRAPSAKGHDQSFARSSSVLASFLVHHYKQSTLINKSNNRRSYIVK